MKFSDFFKRKKKDTSRYSVKENLLILPRTGCSLPHRCIYCNKPIDNLIPAKIYTPVSWFEEFLPIAFISSGLDYVLGFLLGLFFTVFDKYIPSTKKKVVVNLGICQIHRVYRWIQQLVGLSLMLLAFILIYNASTTQITGLVVLSGILLILLSLYIICYSATALRVVQLDSHYAYAKGCGKSFLASLANETQSTES